MHLIVGLGNPGTQYANTRHNAGFLAVENLRTSWNLPDWSDAPKFKGVISEWVYKGEKVILLKPLTYMNLSGESVAPLANFYKIPLENLIVLSDDIDMDFGKIRFREKGSSGGQNGLKSISEKLGSDTFKRIKIGIGRDSKFAVADWVLSKFKTDEIEKLEKEVFPEIREKIEELCS